MAVRRPTPESLREAAWALRDGRLVVFPTETVYGLGANALDPAAVQRIFLAKGRPRDNPLIVHVANIDQARRLASSWPEAAEKLARAFWPGALTLVVPRADDVPDDVSAGLGSIAIRIPAHSVAQAILREAGIPVAAPSANRAGRPSPTRVQDARADLGEKVAVYIDGGPTEFGLESTVVGLLGKKPVLLRVGAIPRETVEEVVGKLGKPSKRGPAHSPGMKYRHYAPQAKLHLVSSNRVRAKVRLLQEQGLATAAIVSEELGMAGSDVRMLGSRDDGAAWARALFATLRDLDAAGYQAIVVEQIPEEGIGAAVMERLRKAAE
ncbi:MAG: threonylcarbamoyl-AMP synthase [Halobacteriales archaeon]|nr:threonylcarbamoyl-AMP synthase [Halobacteriales archaeon]